MVKRFLSLTLLALVISSASTARTWYISNAGSNFNDGLSKEKPFVNFDKVNAESLNATLQPKDSILLKGGETFHGTIEIYYGVDMYIGSYGDGRATIKGSRAVYMQNTSNCTVENLIGIGENTTWSFDGFEFTMWDGNDDFGPRTAKINNVTASGFGCRGIAILTSWPMDTVTVTNCTADNNGWDGISAFGTYEAHNMKNVLISNCFATGNYGSAQRMDWPTGNGISVMFADHVLIENCQVGFNGGNGAFLQGGNSGIYLADVINSRIIGIFSSRNKGNKSYNIDGKGIQLNGGCSNDTLENCDLSQNSGAGFKISDYGVSIFPMENLLFRNNTSYDDGAWRDATITFTYGPNANPAKNIFFDHTTITQSIKHGYVFSNFTNKIDGLKFDSTSICLWNDAIEYMEQPPAFVSITNTIYPCETLAIPTTTRPTPTQSVETKITMYPNPMTNILKVICPKLTHQSELRIITSTGQIITTQSISAGHNAINVSSLPQGVYIAVIRNDYRIIVSEKLVKL